MVQEDGVKRLMEMVVEIAMDGERELYKETTGDVVMATAVVGLFRMADARATCSTYASA